MKCKHCGAPDISIRCRYCRTPTISQEVWQLYQDLAGIRHGKEKQEESARYIKFMEDHCVTDGE
jgi:hypothetical protein